MIIRSLEPEVKIVVDRNPIKTSFEEWARPGHFSRTIANGPDTTTWIWNLHDDAHDFDSHTSDLEEISRKVFSAHFGQLSIIFLWLSGMYFHGASFSNYEAWLSDPTHIAPSAQIDIKGVRSEFQLGLDQICVLIFGGEEAYTKTSFPPPGEAENLNSFCFLLKRVENPDSFCFHLKRAENPDLLATILPRRTPTRRKDDERR
ncbi:hypothetical protein IEQ34_020606 [Dendrobium chrysotoxum]|uniref:Photosystem I P700 chlorophyll a apoprotein A1 n=1 Tax=Dendrobium chrysotoxum TaxID=161865 RepID=A0AAV7G2R8_DENCH|nr:hypothetical protein IEQ34_020606 [Dendrobium chrysotoxum]